MYKVISDGISSKPMELVDAKRFARYCLYKGMIVSIRNMATGQTIKF